MFRLSENSVDVYSANPLTGSAKFNAMAGSMGTLGGDLWQSIPILQVWEFSSQEISVEL